MNDDVRDMIDLLRSKGLTLSLAESCTGGLIGATITDMPGASDVFMGSAVTYSNESKMSILGVSERALAEHGAVSEETAVEMAEGSLKAYGSDVALSVTGIAGPGGATDTKPVGLVYMAITDGIRTKASRHVYDGDRASVRAQTVRDAILQIIEFTGGSE